MIGELLFAHRQLRVQNWSCIAYVCSLANENVPTVGLIMVYFISLSVGTYSLYLMS